MVRSLSRALEVALVLLVASGASPARADSHHLRAQGGAGDHLPGKQYRTVIEKQFPNSGHLMKGRVVEQQLRRMDKMVLAPNTRATVGEWISKHFGNGVARPGESYPTEIAGVWDPATEIFHGLHVTAFHEVVALTINTRNGTYVARKDGGPLIGAARHPSPGVQASSLMRTWGTTAANGTALRLAREGGMPQAESVAYEVTLTGGKQRFRRIHLLASEKSGLIDQRPTYDVWMDAHTGAKVHVTEGLRGGPVLDVQDAGKDPWQPPKL